MNKHYLIQLLTVVGEKRKTYSILAILKCLKGEERLKDLKVN